MGLAPPRLPLRPDRDVPPRVPVRRRRLRRPARDPQSGAGAARRRTGPPGPACSGAALLCRSCPGRSATSISLERFVPISTGSGKALYVGTYLPADGEYQRSRRSSTSATTAKTSPRTRRRWTRSTRRRFRPGAERYPGPVRDAALGKIGKENFSDYFGEDPVGYAGMTAGRSAGCGAAGSAKRCAAALGRAVQILSWCSGLAGLVLLGLRRRWWEPSRWRPRSSLVTAVGAASLAAPRRNEMLMTLIFPLAALALTERGLGPILRPAGPVRSRNLPRRLTALRSDRHDHRDP